MPDFFAGEQLEQHAILEGRWSDIDIPGFTLRNSRATREPDILACARTLCSKYEKLGAVGYCYGGWGVLRLAAQHHNPLLVNCIVCAHPSWITPDDSDNLSDVPVLLLAPEHDTQFTPSLKLHSFQKLVLENRGEAAVEYVHFPGVSHGCLAKGRGRHWLRGMIGLWGGLGSGLGEEGGREVGVGK